MSAGAEANPYQKPLPLIEELIRRFAKPEGVVADWTAGCGTTAVVCAITPDLNDRSGAEFVVNMSVACI
jgi:DNA modification methylase